MSGVLLAADRVLVSPSEPAIDGGAVVLRDERIVDVGDRRELEARHPDAARAEFPGCTVLPGLVNAHVHLTFDVTCDPRPALEAGDAAALWSAMSANAHDLLVQGVTLARDLGDRDNLVAQFRAAVDRGAALGPRLLAAGTPITSPGGHCWFLGGEVGGEQDIRAAIRRNVESGADWVKVMAGGGRMTPAAAPVWASQFDHATLALVVRESHEAGLPVAAHAHGTDTMADCAAVGVDTIEHGGWLTGPTVEPRCYGPRPDVAARIAAAGIPVVPTRSRGWKTWPPEAGLEGLVDRLAWMRREGITLIAGTDAGVGRGHFDDLVEALELYVAAGWTPSEALDTATGLAARALGQDHRTGALRVGMDADAVVVAGDPREDVGRLREVRGVVTAGRVLTPAELARGSVCAPRGRRA